MKYLLLSAVAAGCLIPSYAEAKPLTINPYPQVEAAASDVSEAPMPAPVQRAAPARPAQSFSAGFRVPQPGDAYFDPPSEQPAAKPVVQAPVQEEIVYEAAPVRVDAERYEAEQEEQPLVMRMSESFDDMDVVETQPVREAPPVREVEPVQEIAHVEKPAEKVHWFASRAPLQTPVPAKMQGGGQWTVLEGENVRNILERWTRQEGVDLIWNNQNAFAVLESFEMNGSFEQAVQSLLDQYQDNQVRPIAKLHVDPDSQERTLVVQIKVNS